MNKITNLLDSALGIVRNAKLKLEASSTIASNASPNGIPLSNDGTQPYNTLPLDTTNGTDGLDVYNEDLTQPEPLGAIVTSDVATAGQPEPAEQTNNNPPSEQQQPMETNGPELRPSTVQAAQSLGQQPDNTQINTQTTDDTTSFNLFNDSVTISTGTTTEVEEVTSLQPNGDIEISSTTTNQTGVQVSGTTIDNDSPFDSGLSGSINGGVLNQTSTTNSGSADALSSITENGQLANIDDNAGNLPPGVTISETEGTGLAGSVGVGAGVQSTINTNDGVDLEGNPVPGVEVTANIGVEGNLSGEVVNSEVTTVSRPEDEAGTNFHTESVETGTQQTITGGLGISGNAGISTEFGSGTLENPQTTTLGAGGTIQGEIEVEQTTSDTLGANYNLTEDNDQSQQQQQHLETGIPSVEPGQQFTDSHTVETSQTLAGGNQIQIDQSIQDDDFLTHDDQGNNVTSTSDQAIQSTNSQSTTDVMTSETGNQQQDGSAPDALPSDSEVAFTNTTNSTTVNSGLGSGSITISDDGTADGPMITVEGTGADGESHSTGGLSPDEYVTLANQAAVSNPSNGLLANADPANIGDGGLGEMGNVIHNHDTQQGIDSMLQQSEVNAQNTAADNQLIEQAQQQQTTTTPTTPVDNGSSSMEEAEREEQQQQQQEVAEEEEGDDTVTNTSTEIDDDDGEVDESEESESSASTESESSEPSESSESESTGLGDFDLSRD